MLISYDASPPCRTPLQAGVKQVFTRIFCACPLALGLQTQRPAKEVPALLAAHKQAVLLQQHFSRLIMHA